MINYLVRKRILGVPTILIALCAFVIIGGAFWLARPGNVSANSSDYMNARTQYPNIIGTRLDTCILCHTAPPVLNPFGAAYKANGRSQAALVAIQGLDSDGDGWTNIQEINALTFPGDPNDHPVANTPVPTATNTTAPTATRTLVPTATNTMPPTATKTATTIPTATQTGSPSATATQVPTATSTQVPSATATTGPGPTATQTLVPSATSTGAPKPGPTNTPRIRPTQHGTPTSCVGDGEGPEREDGSSRLADHPGRVPCERDDGRSSKVDRENENRGNNIISSDAFAGQGNQPVNATRAEANLSLWTRIINWLKTIFK